MPPPPLVPVTRTALLLAAAFVAAGGSAKAALFTPREDPGAILHNPDMGWVVYENYPIDQGGGSTLASIPDADWTGTDHVAIMFSWADVERTPDDYDFSKVDYAYDWWKQRGMGLQLRLSTESLLWWNPRGAGIGVPPYVLDQLPADQKQVRQCEGFDYTLVDARNAYYLDRLGRFLRAVAEHYAPDGPRPVSLVDLRGFGLWGEWHTGFQYPDDTARRAGLGSILDVWSSALPRHYLALSYSYDPDSPKALWDGPTDRFDPAYTKTYHDYLHFGGFDHALTKPNITLRRDGAGGAVHSNERQLCEEAFRGLRGPMMSEFCGGFTAAKAGGEAWVRWLVQDALSLHPNYICLLGWQCQDAHDFLTQRPDLVAEGLRTMGYRLVPTRLRCPAKFVAGRPVRVSMDWENRAVGRALRDFDLQLRLTDSLDRPVVQGDAGPVPSSRWLKGRPYRVARTVTFAQVPQGEATLWLRLLDPATGKPIALPLQGGATDGWYPLSREG